MKLTEITPDGKFCYGALCQQNCGFSRIVDSTWQKMFPDSIHSAGIRIRFATSSQSVALRFSVDSYEYSFVAGLPMYLGVQYVVKRALTQKTVVKREVAVAKTVHEEVNVQVAKFATKGTKYCYEIYFPSYARINKFAVETDDDCDLEPYGYENEGKLLFLGGPLSKGMGCTFPSATFPHAVCSRLDMDFCNLAVSQYSFLHARFTKDFPFVPDAVITEVTAAGVSKAAAEEKTEKYLKMLLDVFPNVPIIVLSQPFWGDKSNFYAEKRQALETGLQMLRKEYPARLFHLDGEKMFEYSRYDEYTVSLYNMNDNYNMLLAEKLTALLAFAGIGENNANS